MHIKIRKQDNFHNMPLIDKKLFLLDLKEEIENLQPKLIDFIEENYNGVKQSFIRDFLKLLPSTLSNKSLGSYYNILKNENLVFGIYDYIIVARMMENYNLLAKLYRYIVYCEQKTFWNDLFKLNIPRTHLTKYWNFHPKRKSLKGITVKPEYWFSSLEILVDVYDYLIYILAYNPEYKKVYYNEPQPDPKENFTYPHVKLDEEYYAIKLF